MGCVLDHQTLAAPASVDKQTHSDDSRKLELRYKCSVGAITYLAGKEAFFTYGHEQVAWVASRFMSRNVHGPPPSAHARLLFLLQPNRFQMLDELHSTSTLEN
jgi:hypothetical protein